MEVLKDAYRDIKKMFVVLGHKNAATSVKIFSLAAIIFLIFVLLPVLINFLSIFELNVYLSLSQNFHNIDMDNEMINNAYKSIYLPINDLNSLIEDMFNVFNQRWYYDYNIKWNSFITFIGFNFKYTFFRSIFYLNTFLYSIGGFIFSIHMFSKQKEKGVFYLFAMIFSMEIIIVFLNFWIAFFLSKMMCIIFIDHGFTKIIGNSVSMGIVFYVYKILLERLGSE